MATTLPPDEHGNKDCEMVGMHNMPFIATPWSWVSDHWLSYQGGRCADDEYHFLRCVGHVGVARAPVECKKLHDDFIECAYRLKTNIRYALMQKERQRRGLPYETRPPGDSWRTWFKDF